MRGECKGQEGGKSEEEGRKREMEERMVDRMDEGERIVLVGV